MALTPGSRLGSYEISARLGEGGMGIVFRAHDTKLGRDVAIKVLPDSLAADPDRLARFEREARALAALNHPNIAQIYGLEEAGGTHSIVMELVEGETLAEHLSTPALEHPSTSPPGLPVEEVLGIAAQIVDALEAAHEHGIVHRDLKPANIKVRRDGTVKVLDFGLAKLAQGTDSGLWSRDPDATASPTLTAHAATGAGMILGTAAYMSPEQARGRPVDKRTDVWAFGCVLYELLAGRRAFAGDDTTETIAAVVRDDPVWSQLPPHTPESIRRLLRRCLQKDPQRRLGDIRDARLEIDDARGEQDAGAAEPATSQAPAVGIVTPRGSRRRERIAWAACALATLAAVVTAALAFRAAPPPPELRFDIVTPTTTDPASLAISPDGLKIVFVAESEGRSRLWLRSLDSVLARPLAPTEGAALPFWSPDSRSVGFFADTKLKRIDIEGESVQTLANLPRGFGGTWNSSGDILYAPASGVPILRVTAGGGEPAPATEIQPQHSSHRFPQFLPDARHFLFYVEGAPEARGVWVGQLGDLSARRVLDADAAAVFAASGHLLFVRQETLFAQRFDPDSLQLSGSPVSVAEQASVQRGIGAISASSAGPIAYRMGATVGRRQLTWVDRTGRELGAVGDPIATTTFSPSISPDGQRVAVEQTVSGITNVWLLDLARGVFSRFTFGNSLDLYPVWSPNGRRIVFASVRGGVLDLYEKPATGAGAERQLLATKSAKIPSDWSSDGRLLLYRTSDPNGENDLWVLPVEGGGTAFEAIDTPSDARDGQFSPDGRWIAYQSNESGRFEVYIQSFGRQDGEVGGKWQVSTTGGAQVRWRRDGRELYYIALDGRMMAVPVQLAPKGDTVEPGTPVPLFATRVGGAVQSFARQQYLVSPDGQRFLMGTVVEEIGSPITVVLNWRPRN